jgi:RNA polymerase sigma-70 factor (ECF subfamily)
VLLVRRLRAGDARAFAAVVRDNGGRMLATARRLLRHEEDAQDAVQEAWLLAFRALPGFEGQARLSTWLHRIVVNAALMKLRTQRRRPETSLEERSAVGTCDGADWIGVHAAAGADDDLASRERRALVRRALDRLPARHRDVILLRDFEELDTDATAQRLGTTAGAVKTRLHRARQALRAIIEAEHAASVDGAAVSVDELAA